MKRSENATSEEHKEHTKAEAIGMLGRYCTVCWRNAWIPAVEWADCTQEVYRRLLERIPSEQWHAIPNGDGEEHVEFLRAMDAVKKAYIRRRKHHAGELGGVMDHRLQRSASFGEYLEAAIHAVRRLVSEKQRQVILLSLGGLSVGEIAETLNMPRPRISDLKYKAMKELRKVLGNNEAR